MKSVIICPATFDDVTYIYDFLCDLEEQSLDTELFKTIFRKNLQNPDCHHLVAFQGQQCIGYISMHSQWLLHHCNKVGEIQELYVAPPYRGLGVGSALIQAIEQIAANEGVLHIEVTANQKRQRTHQFYENIGFTKTHYKFVKDLSAHN